MMIIIIFFVRIRWTVGHIPKLSRAACFFLKRGGKITGVVCEEKYRPSPIPKGGLEIMLDVELKIEDTKF